jgi:glycosyltransferase involved in cell wall biosynthesis
VRIGYHAPPPGSHSGVADYAETLRVALGTLGRLDSGAGTADVHLYHLGNNRLHEQIYTRALATPGVIVLHDAVLQHFHLGRFSREEYLSEWVYNYGEWNRNLGAELWEERRRASVDARYFRYPMLRRVIERSRRIIVHNPGAAAIVAAQGGRNIDVIPHFCAVDEDSLTVEAAQLRNQLGIGQGTRLFGIFGYLREPKRILQCIRAFTRLHAIRPQTALLIAGECGSSDLARLLETEARQHSGVTQAIKRVGYLSDRELRIAAGMVDCCLNLRYPGAGETSGIAIRLMGEAKPVILTDSAENADFPPAAALRVRPGVAEAEELFEHMLLVTEYPGIARDIGRVARNHIRRHHGLDTVAKRYWEVLCATVLSQS